MQDAESQEIRNLAAGDLVAIIHIALAGLLGAGVVVTYWAITLWTIGWTLDPRYSGIDWHGWLTLCTLGIGLLSILAGIAIALHWFARAQRRREALLWGISSVLVLALTFVAVVANVLDEAS